jgi:hypothetical protein
MPAGKSLVIDPAESTSLWTLGEKLADPIVAKQESESPLLRHVRLDNVLLPEACQISPADGAQPLVTALSGDPLYFSYQSDGRQMLVLTVNLEQGDLTFRTTFPIMVTNALGWFAGSAGELRESLATGSVADISLASGQPLEAAATRDSARDQEPPASQFFLESPAGRALPLPSGIAAATVGPLDECGVWRVVGGPAAGSSRDAVGPSQDAAKAPPLVELACNLASRTESDLRVPEELLASGNSPAQAAAAWFVRPIWFYLIALAWLLATLEWFLYQRRWIS